QQAGDDMTARARYLTRNNGYAINAVESWAGNVVGTGIKPSSKISGPALKDKVQKLWLRWTDEADAEGLTDFYGLQRRAAREVFIAGDDTYYELELNALGVIYEVFYLWRDAYPQFGPDGRLVSGKPYFAKDRFDILRSGAVSFGGNFDRHDAYFWTGINPRGLRWVYRNWDFPGLEVAVRIDGKLNDPSVVSKGWTAELKFPWKGFADIFGKETVCPAAGNDLHMFLGRYNLFHFNGKPLNAGWSWHPIGVADNHNPERFGTFRLG
ncbi:MAG: phage portal protein, partial [Bacteroidales bacterium]|nr:phage portal protein [Bacteroidales bacterium]